MTCSSALDYRVMGLDQSTHIVSENQVLNFMLVTAAKDMFDTEDLSVVEDEADTLGRRLLALKIILKTLLFSHQRK
jgi:hypothetical protein